LVLLVATPVLLWIAFAAAGGGHGSYLPAKLLFPYTMASTAFTGELTLPSIAVGVLQYPIYGVLLDWARSASRFGSQLWTLVSVHVFAVVVALMFSNPSFTP
jgi:hypothetical protein